MVEADFVGIEVLDPNFLAGVWKGNGTKFDDANNTQLDYVETTEFKLLQNDGIWLYSYNMCTTNKKTNAIEQAESGFWKIYPKDKDGLRKIEANIANSMSFNEFEVGFVGKDPDTGFPYIKMAADEPMHLQRIGSVAETKKKTSGLRRQIICDLKKGIIMLQVSQRSEGEDEWVRHLRAVLKRGAK